MQGQGDLISERSAWKGASIGGKEGLVFELSSEQIAVLDFLMRKTRDKRCEDITRDDFDHPVVNALLAKVAEEMAEGRGAAVLRGLSREKYSDDDLTRIFWGIGTHLGIAGPQNTAGDRIDHVRDMGSDNPLGRRQYGTQELVFHTDGIIGQILGLLSLSKSKSGGLSRVASALTIHNEFVKHRPDLLEVLYEGYPYHRKGKQAPGEPLVTPFSVPVFSKIDGIVTVQYIRDYMTNAAKELGQSLPPKLLAALNFFDEVANRADVNVTFMLEPGEIMLVNNRAVLHSRTEFVDFDEPERKRHLVRLWFYVKNGRPYKPEMDYLHRGAQMRELGLATNARRPEELTVAR